MGSHEISHNSHSLDFVDVVTLYVPGPETKPAYLERTSKNDILQKKASGSEDKTPSRSTYIKMCKRLGSIPRRQLVKQLGTREMYASGLCLGTADLKALCCALLLERKLMTLHLSDNCMGPKEMNYVSQVLAITSRLTELNLSNNKLGHDGLAMLVDAIICHQQIKRLDISGNKFTDNEGDHISLLIKESSSLYSLKLSHNEFREQGGIKIGKALGENCTLRELDLSWNHIRRMGAVGIAKGISVNKHLKDINLSWNGFGYEGCVAMSEALQENITLCHLDLASNRIHPPALLVFLKGLMANKVLVTLTLSQNPITPALASVLLNGIKQSPHMAIEELELRGIIVDEDFESILNDIRETRRFEVKYERSIQRQDEVREMLLKELDQDGRYNVDPIRLMYILKENMRAQDFFWKINKEHDDGVTRTEMHNMFKQAGFPITDSGVDKIFDFLDVDGDGVINLLEFIQGDRRMKRYARAKAREDKEKEQDNDKKYSSSFRRVSIGGGGRLQVSDNRTARLSPTSRLNSLSPDYRRGSRGVISPLSPNGFRRGSTHGSVDSLSPLSSPVPARLKTQR